MFGTETSPPYRLTVLNGYLRRGLLGAVRFSAPGRTAAQRRVPLGIVLSFLGKERPRTRSPRRWGSERRPALLRATRGISAATRGPTSGKTGNYPNPSLVGLIGPQAFCRPDPRSELDDDPEAA